MFHYRLLLSFFLGLFLISCDRPSSYNKTLPLDKTFRMSIATEPPTLDWTKATDAVSSIILDNIMSGLTAFDFSNKEQVNYKPDLARSIQSRNQGKTWIFKLRSDVYWSDGVPFTGQHIIDSWERLLNPETGAAYAYFLFHIKNAKEYNSGKIKDFSKVGVKLTPQGDIRVDLTGSKYFFPHVLTHTSTFPIRKDIIEKHDTKWTEAENMITLGPYSLDKWEHDKIVIIKKNPSYYGKMEGNVENVMINIIPEKSTSINLFDSKKLDFVDELPSEQLPYFKKRPEFVSQSTFITFYLGFNTEKPPLNNPKLRKAIAMAIDRNQIAQMFHNQVQPLSGWIPKGLFGYNPNIGLKFNPERAKALYDSIPKPLPKITLSYNMNDDNKRITENVQAQLKKNLNLDVEIVNEEWKLYLENLRLGKAMMYRMGWLPDYPDPHNFMNLMTSYSENNYTRYKDTQFDKLVEQSGILPDGNKRMRLYNQAQRKLVEENALVIPIFYRNETRMVSKRVKFYPHNVMRKFIFKQIVLN